MIKKDGLQTAAEETRFAGLQPIAYCIWVISIHLVSLPGLVESGGDTGLVGDWLGGWVENVSSILRSMAAIGGILVNCFVFHFQRHSFERSTPKASYHRPSLINKSIIW